MYPASFDYVAPTSLDEAIALLDQHGHDAKVIAGGQSLIPLMKFRFAGPAVLVDINRIPGLATIAEGDGGLRIGALVAPQGRGARRAAARWPVGAPRRDRTPGC